MFGRLLADSPSTTVDLCLRHKQALALCADIRATGLIVTSFFAARDVDSAALVFQGKPLIHSNTRVCVFFAGDRCLFFASVFGKASPLHFPIFPAFLSAPIVHNQIALTFALTISCQLQPGYWLQACTGNITIERLHKEKL